MSEPAASKGAEAYAWVLQLQAKCQALQTPEKTQAKIEAWEAEQKARDQKQAERMRVEAARSKLAAAQAYAEKAQKDQDEKIAAGLVEVRVDPGKTWSLQWFEDHISFRVPDLRPEALDRDLGTLAILRAVDLLTQQRKQGRCIKNAAGFVVTEARRAMARRGGPTTWVDEATAQKTPHLIVRRYDESFAGRVSSRWQQRQRRLDEDDQRRALGLLPLWAVASNKKPGIG